MPTATDEKLAADLASFRAEITRDMSAFRADLAGFQGEVKSDLKWIKGIGAALLLTAFSFAGWIISDMATVKLEVRQQESRLDKMDKQLERQGERLDGMAKQLDILIGRTAPKAP